MLTNDRMDYRCECASSQYSGRHCELFNEKPFDIYISGESLFVLIMTSLMNHFRSTKSSPWWSGQNLSKRRISHCIESTMSLPQRIHRTELRKCKNDSFLWLINDSLFLKTQMISINGPRSYAVVNAESGARYRAMNLTFSFKTSSKNGILFYASAQGRLI